MKSDPQHASKTRGFEDFAHEDTPEQVSDRGLGSAQCGWCCVTVSRSKARAPVAVSRAAVPETWTRPLIGPETAGAATRAPTTGCP